MFERNSRQNLMAMVACIVASACGPMVQNEIVAGSVTQVFRPAIARDQRVRRVVVAGSSVSASLLQLADGTWKRFDGQAVIAPTADAVPVAVDEDPQLTLWLTAAGQLRTQSQVVASNVLEWTSPCYRTATEIVCRNDLATSADAWTVRSFRWPAPAGVRSMAPFGLLLVGEGGVCVLTTDGDVLCAEDQIFRRRDVSGVRQIVSRLTERSRWQVCAVTDVRTVCGIDGAVTESLAWVQGAAQFSGGYGRSLCASADGFTACDGRSDALAGVTAIDVGNSFMCGLDESGAALCMAWQITLRSDNGWLGNAVNDVADPLTEWVVGPLLVAAVDIVLERNPPTCIGLCGPLVVPR